jgi:hypothetical protein
MLWCTSVIPSVRAAPATPTTVALSPKRFAEISSGVTLIHTYGCGGRLTGSGSGFLIGDRIVVTARHVMQAPGERAACRTRVRAAGQWIGVQAWNWWRDRGDRGGRTVDLAILKLRRRVPDAHLFTIRATPVRIGTNLAALGHPLGNQLSVTQGRLVARRRVSGVPIMFVKLLGAEGASGSAFVDNAGNAVGLLQLGFGGKDVLGQRTSGLTAGLDLSSWWGSGRRDLCRAYPDGGIPMCGPKTPPPATAPPDSTPSSSTPPPTSPGRSPSPDTFVDPPGDSGTAPDVTAIVVSRDGGWVSFKIQLTSPLVANQRVMLHLDTTGDFEDDYTWSGSADLFNFWIVRGTDQVSVNPAWLHSVNRGNELEVSLELAGIGDPARLNFLIISQAWVGVGNQPVVVDYDESPASKNDTTYMWEYGLQ